MVNLGLPAHISTSEEWFNFGVYNVIKHFKNSNSRQVSIVLVVLEEVPSMGGRGVNVLA